jgi:hypothetical protein
MTTVERPAVAAAWRGVAEALQPLAAVAAAAAVADPWSSSGLSQEQMNSLVTVAEYVESWAAAPYCHLLHLAKECHRCCLKRQAAQHI